MSHFIETELDKADKAWRPYRYLILAILGLLLFGLGTCVGVKCTMDAATVHSDTARVIVAGATPAHKPVPTSITYDDSVSFGECYPLPVAQGDGFYVKQSDGVITDLWKGWVWTDTGLTKSRVVTLPAIDTGFFIRLSHADSITIVNAYLRDYAAQVIYNRDSLRIDTAGITGYVVPIDTLRFNRIQGRSWSYRFSLPVITNTVHLPAAKPKKWGIGLQLGMTYLNGRAQPYAGAGISYNPVRF